MNDRIKLAEAIGWERKGTWNGEPMYEHHCGRSKITHTENGILKHEYQIFDPFTDANDCEALIAFLDGDLLTITVTFGKGVRFDHYNGTKEEWEGLNWKQGVCELALKVLT